MDGASAFMTHNFMQRQFILRIKPEFLADEMRDRIRSGNTADVEMSMEDGRGLGGWCCVWGTRPTRRR